MKILIIEDEYSLADAISDSLQKENFETKIITNGEDGEDEALTEEYDLILLDVMLPGKNGFEILKELRNEKVDTPVIMLTAKSELEDKSYYKCGGCISIRRKRGFTYRILFRRSVC